MLRWIGKTQLSTCRQTSVNETCIEIETVGRHDVTVNAGNSFLPADIQTEKRTAGRQDVTVDREDSVIHLQTDNCEQDMHRNRDCRPT